ncbi:MAG: YdiU family protein [Neptuniibacter sp.]
MILKNSYLDLGEEFFQRINPKPVSDPNLFLWNTELAEELGLPDALTQDAEALSQYFSGNKIFPESTPIALAYTGHQFGQLNPRLGDGRAHLLGEIETENGSLDIQLKGSGPTLYSRRGDGRCALGPAVREFIMSEAMHALGVPTTKALAVVTTGDPVIREGVKPGAVVTRVASSHLRVGTFEFFASQGNVDAVETLCNYAIARHYPELKELSGPERFTAFYAAVLQKQIELICEWMRIGFIHGVMNTDNTTISGETIDYGPCAMMNAYNPNTVFSSIDVNGRYRFGHQPQIGQWNMARLAECLLPLFDEDSSKAQEIAQQLLGTYSENFKQHYFAMLGRKIGLDKLKEGDQSLLDDLLNRMRKNAMDYTQTFNLLTESINSVEREEEANTQLGDWFNRWKTRLNLQNQDDSVVYNRMRSQNPVVIPRNQHMEAVIESCVLDGSSAETEAFLKVLKSPYKELENTHQYQDAPKDGDSHYQTFCGT